jgi:outer membrane lipoprotein-sorting protein
MKNLLRFNFVILALMLFMAMAVFISSPHAENNKPTAAQDIQKAEKYLQGLDTLKADFIQTAHNGYRMSGTFYLNRPGKLRFDYNEVDDFVVADGTFIYFYDAELQEQTNAPIGQTLADFLLREDLSLTKDLTVNKIQRDKGFITMNLSEKGEENAGYVTLFFDEEPYALKKWQVTDAAGLTTEILLRNVKRDVDLPATLFRYFKPKQDKPAYN